MLGCDKFGAKKIKLQVQIDSAKFWNNDKTPCECLPELKGAYLDCVVQFSKTWTGVDQWGVGIELKHTLVTVDPEKECPF